MKNLPVFIALFFVLLCGTPQAMAQNKAKMSKAERKVMKESNTDDKDDQRSYSRTQQREHKKINRRERKAQKREGRI